MVLIFNGLLQATCPQNIQSFYNSHTIYQETASQLTTIPKKIIGPSGLLYVLQREFAATVLQDENVSVIGTDDATTCIIVIVKHSPSGAVALGHFDGSGTKEGVLLMVQRVQELSSQSTEGQLEVQLIGGYSDTRHYSENLFFDIINSFHIHPAEINVTLVCVGQLNSTVQEDVTRPIICGIGIDIKTGEIFPASFPDKGPLESLRNARHLSGNLEMLEIYDCSLRLLKIGPFNYGPMRGVDFWLLQSDEFILQQLSTSPEVEPPHFVSQIRSTLKYIQENPFPALSTFKDNRPLYFRRDHQTGIWTPVEF